MASYEAAEGSQRLTSEAVDPSDEMTLPPPAHLWNVITQAPLRPPRNKARLASTPYVYGMLAWALIRELILLGHAKLARNFPDVEMRTVYI